MRWLQPEAHRLAENRDECAPAEQIGLGGPVLRRDQKRSETLGFGRRSRSRGRVESGDGEVAAVAARAAWLGKGE